MWNRSMEGAALARPAIHPDSSLVHLDEPSTDGEAETDPRRIAQPGRLLVQTVEDRLGLFGTDAAARVPDRENGLIGRLFDGDLDTSCLGELDGVADQIQQCLPHLSL